MGESSHAEQAENYAATIISSMSFGMYLMLSLASLQFLLKRRRRTGGQNTALIYTVAMLAVSVIWFVSSSRWSAYYFVDMPYNPLLAKKNLLCTPAGLLSRVTAMLQYLLSDGLLMYRTYMIWENELTVVLVPTLAYIGVVGVGITMNLQCGVHVLGGEVNHKLHEAFWFLTICCNVFATAAIASRLIMHRRALQAIGLSERPTFSEYTTIVGILTESALLYALVGIAYLPVYFKNLPSVAVLSSTFEGLTYLSPAVIILRVALGLSYDRAPQSTLPWHGTEVSDITTEASPATPQPPHHSSRGWSSPSALWKTEKFTSQFTSQPSVFVDSDIELPARTSTSPISSSRNPYR